MWYNINRLIEVTGNKPKAQAIHEWAKKNPAKAYGLSEEELVRKYNLVKESGTPEKQPAAAVENKVEQVHDDSADEAQPQPLFTGYGNVKLPLPDKQVLYSEHIDIEELFDEEGIDYSHLYRLDNHYYEEQVEGSIEVLFAPVNDPKMKNYFITTDGMLVRWVKKHKKYVVAGVQQSSMTHNLFISKWMRDEKKQIYYTVSAMMVRTFKERDYDKRNALVISAKNGREGIAIYNVKGYYVGDDSDE